MAVQHRSKELILRHLIHDLLVRVKIILDCAADLYIHNIESTDIPEYT